jgi:hypothetical protein
MPDQQLIPVKRGGFPAKDTVFANDIVIQHMGDHFIVSFFQIMPPLIIGDTQEERDKTLSQISEIEAQCVGRIVLTPEGLQELIEHADQNYKNWQQKQSGDQAHTEEHSGG